MKRISYDHPEYSRIKAEASKLIDGRFNHIQLDVFNKISEDMLYENILRPSFKVMMHEWADEDRIKELRIECQDDTENCDLDEDEFLEWMENHNVYYDEIDEHFMESEHYPMWNTLFEIRDTAGSRFFENHVDELYEIGLGVIEDTDYFNSTLFISGAGYDFYEAHWIPLFTQVFKWIDTETTKEK